MHLYNVCMIYLCLTHLFLVSDTNKQTTIFWEVVSQYVSFGKYLCKVTQQLVTSPFRTLLFKPIICRARVLIISLIIITMTLMAVALNPIY